MKKIILALSIILLSIAPANASVLHKVKAVALFPVRIVKNVAAMSLTAISITLVETVYTWAGEPPL